MEKNLYDAAAEGNVPSLLKLLKDDPLLLDRCTVGPYAESPLHVASLLGRVEFANEILSRKPELASELDSGGSSPLHFAAAKGYLGIVKSLLVANPEMCFSRDKYGRNPVHVSAIKGRADVLKEMVRVRPGAAYERMSNGDTILLLCMRNNRLECLKELVSGSVGDQELVNSKNGDGDTLLHLAAADRQIEMMNFLIHNTKIDPTSPNRNGFTALDIFAQASVSQASTNYALLRNDVEPTTQSPSPEHMSSTSMVVALMAGIITLQVGLNSSRGGARQDASRGDGQSNPKNREDWPEKMRSALMVVAILTATMAFQVAINPPGGVWPDSSEGDGQSGSHKAGFSIMADNYPSSYPQFLIFNTVSFVASLSIILLLISGFSLSRRLFVWILMVMMWVAITGNAFTFAIAVASLTPAPMFKSVFFDTKVSIMAWDGLIVLLIVATTVRLAIWLGRRLILRRRNPRPSSTVSTDDGV